MLKNIPKALVMSDNCCTFVVSNRGAGNTIKTAVTHMYLYLITDSDGWVDWDCYTSADKAISNAKVLIMRKEWDNTQHMKVLKLNSRTHTCTRLALVRRGEHGARVEFC